MDRASVERWIEGYERVWRTAGTEGLGDLFSSEATYLVSPWAPPVSGLARLAELWEAERDGPDETFAMVSEVLAVDHDTAVVRVAVDYGDPVISRWRDLWLLRFDGAGHCCAFEEWPFAPGQPDGH